MESRQKADGQADDAYEGWEFCGLRVEPSVVNYLRELGGGDPSQGARVLVQFHRERVGEGK